jgi:hypothetical protein
MPQHKQLRKKQVEKTFKIFAEQNTARSKSIKAWLNNSNILLFVTQQLQLI